jgi:RNA polymerase sigma-70 factor (ECF subfamily)
MTEERPVSPPVTDSRHTSRSLLERARHRDPAAWQRLVSLYEPLVRHWCRRGVVAPQDSDDVVQEVFATAFAALDTFRHAEHSGSFRGWLQGVTRNRVKEHFRRLRRDVQGAGGSDAYGVLLGHAGLPDLPDHPDEEERALCGQLYRRALELVRCDFEPHTWQMFVRSVIDGQPSTAIAAEMGTTAGAVRQARSRVLRRLREEAEGLNLEIAGAEET